MAFSSLAEMVQHFESGGDYASPAFGPTNPTSSASGAYQFLTGTWQQYAPAAGVNVAQYPTAASAPPAMQDAVFAQAVQQRGLGDWTCPGCNSALSAYLAANPDQANLPVLPSSPASVTASPGTTPLTTGAPAGTGYSSDANAPGYGAVPEAVSPEGVPINPATGVAAGTGSGAPVQVGLEPSLANAVTSIATSTGNAVKQAVAGTLGTLGNLGLRAGLILVAVVLIGVALAVLMTKGASAVANSDTGRTVARAAAAAAA